MFVESPDANPSIWDGNWHLATGTYDGAAVRLYVDGVQVGSGTPTSLAINYTGLDHTNFDIGAYRDAACTLGFTGAIDEVRLFNRALSAPEILSIYQTTPNAAGTDIAAPNILHILHFCTMLRLAS